MHIEIVRGLRIRHAPLFDQPHRLKLELACKLPSLHDAPPAPSKHLTRCLRNRVQATHPVRASSETRPRHGCAIVQGFPKTRREAGRFWSTSGGERNCYSHHTKRWDLRTISDED